MDEFTIYHLPKKPQNKYIFSRLAKLVSSGNKESCQSRIMSLSLMLPHYQELVQFRITNQLV